MSIQRFINFLAFAGLAFAAVLVIFIRGCVI
jgi:hypothetical protein